MQACKQTVYRSAVTVDMGIGLYVKLHTLSAFNAVLCCR